MFRVIGNVFKERNCKVLWGGCVFYEWNILEVGDVGINKIDIGMDEFLFFGWSGSSVCLRILWIFLVLCIWWRVVSFFFKDVKLFLGLFWRDKGILCKYCVKNVKVYFFYLCKL